MKRYSDDTLSKLRLLENQMALVIEKETGANVEVTTRGDWVAFYSEHINLKNAVMALIARVDTIGGIISDYDYEADEDGPAAFNVKYQLI